MVIMINNQVFNTKSKLKIALLESDYERQDQIWQIIHNYGELIIYRSHRDFISSKAEYDFAFIGIEQNSLDGITVAKLFRAHKRTGCLLAYSFSALCPYEVKQIESSFDYHIHSLDLQSAIPSILSNLTNQKFVA